MEFTSGKAEEPWKSMKLQEKGGKKRCKESRKDVQMNIYQSNTYQKDLSRLHFNKEQRVQKKKKKKKVANQQSYTSVSAFCPTYPSSSWKQKPRHDNKIPRKAV